MSYLNSPRLTFSGQFQADPSTVNNDPTHYDTVNFKPNFQDYSSAENPNGWWNPDGTGNWRFIGCKIKSVTYKDGTSTNDPKIDPIIGMSIMDTDSRTAGKIVDLDPQQQGVSELWGLIVRIVSPDGTEMMRGNYEVSPFIDLWFGRSVDMTGDGVASAIYQSVLKNIKWNKKFTNSRYLNEIREASNREISMNFTVDRYKDNNNDPQFTMGRIAGSMGPTNNKEPERFTLGRQLFPTSSTNSFAMAYVDEDLNHIMLNLGNALQFSSQDRVNDKRDLRLAINTGSATKPKYVVLGKIDYNAPNWYMMTAGVCTFPFLDKQKSLILGNPLCILSAVTTPPDVFTAKTKTTYAEAFTESIDYVRADQFVYRLDPGGRCSIRFYATRLGKSLPNVKIEVQDDTANVLGKGQDPPIGTPEIPYFSNGKKHVVTTDERGIATLSFKVTDPGNPRKYIDGQVYGLSYNLSTQNFAKDCNPNNFISIQVYSGPLKSNLAPNWKSLQPIMQQYANLYPLMSKGIFNLADIKVIDNNAEILKLVFSKDKTDPNYMPATRDLSGHKSKIILQYLQNILDNKN